MRSRHEGEDSPINQWKIPLQYKSNSRKHSANPNSFQLSRHTNEHMKINAIVSRATRLTLMFFFSFFLRLPRFFSVVSGIHTDASAVAIPSAPRGEQYTQRPLKCKWRADDGTSNCQNIFGLYLRASEKSINERACTMYVKLKLTRFDWVSSFLLLSLADRDYPDARLTVNCDLRQCELQFLNYFYLRLFYILAEYNASSVVYTYIVCNALEFSHRNFNWERSSLLINRDQLL